jgi:Protein phosphatase 2C
LIILLAGNLASKFVAGALYETLINHLPNLNQHHDILEVTFHAKDTPTPPTWKDDIRINVTRAFEELHTSFLETLATMPAPPIVVGAGSAASNMDQSGTTATALLATDSVIVVASLGDSRAVLSSSSSSTRGRSSGAAGGAYEWRDIPSVSAIPLTVDHVASNPVERALVIQRGGTVVGAGTNGGGLPRVNGTLAITRSIGDASLSPVLSREPYVLALERWELRDWCGSLGTSSDDEESKSKADGAAQGVSQIPCFIVRTIFFGFDCILVGAMNLQ